MPAKSPEEFVERFAAGWHSPHPHAWNDLLHPEIELRQRLLPPGRGKQWVTQEYGRLLALLPDLRGKVTAWSARPVGDDTLIHISLELTATIGSSRLKLPLTDVCRVRDGLLVERESHLDPTPAVVALLRAPSLWVRWWRSGVGPLASRRRLRTTTRTATALAAGRILLGAPALSAPALSARVYGFAGSDRPDVRYLTAIYGARAAALGIGTLLADPRHRRLWQTLGLRVDIADTVTALRTPLPVRTRVLSTAITGGYAIAGGRDLHR